MKTITKHIGQKAQTVVKPYTKSNDEINELIKQTTENNGFISIKGYTTSKGALCNYLVQPLGPNGYKRLVRESLEALNDVKNKKGFNKIVFNVAKEEMKESFLKTLNDKHNITNNYNKEKKAFYSHNDNDCFYIRNIVIVKRQVIIEGEKSTTKSREKTLAKQHIKNQLPVGKYQGCFKLDNTKFEQITFNKTTIAS